MKVTSSFLSVTLLCSALAMLPGCSALDWLKSKMSCKSCAAGTVKPNEPVITFGGKPVVSVEEFKNKLQAIYAARPGIESIIAQMPEEEQLKIYKQLADGIVAEQLILEYVKRKGLEKTPEFKEAVEQGQKQLYCDISVRAFQTQMAKEMQEMIAKIDDKQAEDYYNANLEKSAIFQQAPFTVKQGRVVAQVSQGFKTEAEAKKTLSNPAAAFETMDSSATSGKKQMSDYRLRSAVMGMKTNAEVVKGADKFFAVKIKEKTTPEFAKFADVKDMVKQAMVQEKMPSMYNEKMEDLKKDCKVSVNEEFLKSFVVKKEQAAQPEQTPAPAAAAPAVKAA